jgi:hypothetical protein
MECRLVHPTDDTRVITKVAKLCLKKLFKPGIYYKKVGIMLGDLVDKKHIQLDLFHQYRDEDLLKKDSRTYGILIGSVLRIIMKENTNIHVHENNNTSNNEEQIKQNIEKMLNDIQAAPINAFNIIENYKEFKSTVFLPQGIEELNRPSGKKARKFIQDNKKFNIGSSNTIKSRKKLNNFIGEHQANTSSPFGNVVTLYGSINTAYENIQNEAVCDTSTIATEVAYRAFEWGTDTIASGFILRGAALLLAPEATIPALLYFAGTEGIKLYVIPALREFFEDNTKPYVREWLRLFIKDEVTNNRDPQLTIVTLPSDFTVSQEGINIFLSSQQIGITTADGKITDQLIKYINNVSVTFENQTDIYGQKKIYLNASTMLENNQAIEIHAGIKKDERGKYIPFGEGVINIPINTTTSVDINTQISGSTNTPTTISLGSTLNYSESPDSHFSIGGQISLTKENTFLTFEGIKKTPDTSINAKLTLGAGGAGLGLIISSTNPIAMGVAAIALTGMGIYMIADACKTRPLPFLSQDHPDNLRLAKLLRNYKNKSLTEDHKQNLIQQIERCDTPNCADQNGAEILHAMKFNLLNTKENACARWYKSHDFKQDVDFYKSEFEKQSQKIQKLALYDIGKAREELVGYVAQFPHETAAKQLKQTLYNKEVLFSQILWLVDQQKITEADNNFNTVFKRDTDKNLYQIMFARKKIQRGYVTDGQLIADDVIQDLSNKNELNKSEQQLKNNAICLCTHIEAIKPINEQSLEYINSHIDMLPAENRKELFQLLNGIYEEKKRLAKEDLSGNYRDVEKQQLAVLMPGFKNEIIHHQLFLQALKLGLHLNQYKDVASLISTLSSQTSDAHAVEINQIAYTLYTHASNQGNGVSQFAEDMISTLLKIPNLSDKDFSQCHLYIGSLLSVRSKFDRTQVLEHYKQSFGADHSNKDSALGLADEYCRILRYNDAKNVLNEAITLNSNDEELKNKSIQVEVRSIKMQLLCFNIAMAGVRRLLPGQEENKGNKRTIFSRENCLSFEYAVTLCLELHLQNKLKGTIQFQNQNNDNSLSKKVGYAQMGISLMNTALNILSMYVDQEDMAQFSTIEKIQLGTNIIGLGLTCYITYDSIKTTQLFSKPTSQWSSNELLTLTATGFTIGHQLGSIGSFYFQKQKAQGNAPESTLGILTESICNTLGHPLLGLTLQGYQHLDALFDLAQGIQSTFPGMAEIITTHTNDLINSLANLGNTAITAGGTLWASGLAGKVVLTTGAIGVVCLIGYGAYKYHESRQYNNKITNILTKVQHSELAKVNDKISENERAELSKKELLIAKNGINELLKDWPNDTPALDLLDRITVLEALNNPEDLKTAIGLCSNHINKNEKNEVFRQLRIRAILTIAQHADQNNLIPQAMEDVKTIIDLHPEKITGWWYKVALEELKTEYASALKTLEELSEKAPELLNTHQDLINTIRQELIKKVELTYNTYFNSYKKLCANFWDSLNRKRDEFIPHDKLLEHEMVIAENNTSFICKNNCLEKSEPIDPNKVTLYMQENGAIQVKENGVLESLGQDIEHLTSTTHELTHYILSNISPWFKNFAQKCMDKNLILYPEQRNLLIQFIEKQYAHVKNNLSGYNYLKENQELILKNINTIESGVKDFVNLLFESINHNNELVINKITVEKKEALAKEVPLLIEGLKLDIEQRLTENRTKILKLSDDFKTQQELKKQIKQEINEIKSRTKEIMDRSINLLLTKASIDIIGFVLESVQKIIYDEYSNTKYNKSSFYPLPELPYGVEPKINKVNNSFINSSTTLFGKQGKKLTLFSNSKKEKPNLITASSNRKTLTLFGKQDKKHIVPNLKDKPDLITVSRNRKTFQG